MGALQELGAGSWELGAGNWELGTGSYGGRVLVTSGEFRVRLTEHFGYCEVSKLSGFSHLS